MISKKFKLASLLCFALCSVMVVFTSCGDDEEPTVDVVMGCTDAAATNYDALAVEDDGSCTFARDNFIGDYLSSLTCPNDPILMNISTDSLTFAIAEGLDPDDLSSVNVAFTSGVVAGLGFDAVIDGDNLTIPEVTFEGLPFEFGGATVVLDITASGAFTLTDSDLVGTISLDAKQESGATLGTDTCDVVGVKQ